MIIKGVRLEVEREVVCDGHSPLAATTLGACPIADEGQVE